MEQHQLVLDSSKFLERRNAHLAEAFEPNPFSQSSAVCRSENMTPLIRPCGKVSDLVALLEAVERGRKRHNQT